MQSIQEIKRRINSISSIKKITRAMQLVATSKLQKVKKNFIASHQYWEATETIFNLILSDSNFLVPFLNQDQTQPALIILITSDLGLSGAYNLNVFKLFQKEFKPNDKLIVIGAKGINLLKNLNFKIDLEVNNLGESINYKSVYQIVEFINNYFLKGLISNFKIISTKYINSITFVANIWSLVDDLKNNLKVKNNQIEYEPSSKEVLIKSLPIYLKAIIFDKLVESKLSEMASRRMSMEKATNNAIELIDQLVIKYNQARQSAITQEISEIIVGSGS